MKMHNPIKMRNRISQAEVYYTYPHWPSKDIDGVEFLPVVKQPPSQSNTQTIHYMRKDSLEKVKA
jgi:hypothetical protein